MERESSPTAAKAALRRMMRERLRSLDTATRAEASLVMCGEAAQLCDFREARCVALFAPLASEPDIHPLIEEAWAEKKRVLLPLMIPRQAGPELDWHEVTSWEEVVVPGPFGLREPDPLRCPRVAATEIDCAFIPGVAFDGEGFRLGRGGGFYDYFLTHITARTACIGLIFACQQIDAVPRETHDRQLPRVVTEEGVLSFPASGN